MSARNKPAAKRARRAERAIKKVSSWHASARREADRQMLVATRGLYRAWWAV